MSLPLSVLGLAADADERAIKRAYAAKLKSVRPDEDPEGFQRLNEAYRAALRWVQSRPAGGTTDRGGGASPQPQSPLPESPRPESPRPESPQPGSPQPGSPVDEPPGAGEPPKPAAPPANLQVRPAPETREPPPAEPAPSAPPPPAPPPFDAARFHYAFALAAANASPHGFRHWLDTQPELLSLQLKARLSRSLLAFLAEEQPPMRQDNFDAFCACFGYDDVASGQDAMQLRALARRLHRVWQAEGGERHGVTIAIPCDESGWPAYGAERGEARIAEVEQRNHDKALASIAWSRFPELRRPAWSWIEMGLLCLVFGRERRIAELLRRHGQDTWPAGTNRRVADFWRDAADRTRSSFARRFQRAVRILVYGGTAAGLPAFLLLGDGGSALLQVAGIVLGVVAVPLSLLLIGGLLDWQSQPDPPGRFGRALRYATIPALLVAAFVLGEIPPHSGSALPAGLALLTSLLRYRARNGALGWMALFRRVFPWSWLQVIAILGAMLGLVPAMTFVNDSPWGIPAFSWTCAALALGFWAKDAAMHLRAKRQP